MKMFSLEMCHMYVVAKARRRGGREKRKRSHTDQYEERQCLRRYQRITAQRSVDPRFYTEKLAPARSIGYRGIR
jgi:hypothetical protein